LELSLSAEQQAALETSAKAIRANIQKLTQQLAEPAQLAVSV
jgi:hypothetical protein